jgi:TatD DNase family protein
MPEDNQPDSEKTGKIISDLASMVAEAQSQPGLVAFGEFGLDYDRLHYCSKTIQLHSFAAQLKLAASLQPQLPLFLHSRAAHSDLVSLLKATFGERLEKLERGGVVHSFTGTVEEMKELTDLGLYIGVNGCSFKTAENCAVVKEIGLNRIMLETDGPWCEVRPSHEGWKYLIEGKHSSEPGPGSVNGPIDGHGPAQQSTKPPNRKKNQPRKESEVPERYKIVKKEKWEDGAMVKGRNEPCMIERVAKIVAGIKGIDMKEVCEAAWENTRSVFDLKE